MKRAAKIACFLALVVLWPALAEAHSAGDALNGWHDGFNHPLHGWDHLLVMVAVGLWAAQQRSRAIWLYPMTFVGAMGMGGVFGAAGLNLPGVETAILISVFAFGCLVIGRVRIKTPAAIAIITLFAFFHGYAHGREMPGSIGVVSFGLGFMLATLLLHMAGLLTARLVALGLVCLAGSSAMAQEGTNSASGSSGSSTNPAEPVRLPEVVVTGRQDSLVGIADSASQGTTGAAQLADRPILRSGEILESVPGVIITQHAGGGKANQYFLRGFNLDHGTDFAIYLDGMPLNLPSHAHGEGYADMNVVIPEFVQRVDYEKGPYYADVGNYGSAGAAHLVFYSLPQNFATVEGGMYGYARGVFGISQRIGSGTLTYGGEAYHDDGPWTHPDDYQKFNGILTYSQGDDANGFSVTGRGYHGKWNSSDQIPASFGATNFFGTLNPTDGGDSGRYSLQAERHRHDANSETKVLVYGFYYNLDLFSDFTYFLGYECEQYTARHHRRLETLPGLTGLWQVSGKNRTTFEEMIDLDVHYVDHRSLFLDLSIICRTIPAIVAQVIEQRLLRNQGSPEKGGANLARGAGSCSRVR